jgi:L-amino acid N-acyltransferase
VSDNIFEAVMIRDAHEGDLPAILAITNDAILNTTAIWDVDPVSLESRRDWWADRVRDGFPVLVADADGTVRGFGSYGPFRPRAGFRHTVEHSVYVAPDTQGQGIGRAMLRALIERAEAARLHVMIGGIEAGNVASIALHKAAGFQEAGTLRESGHKFGRWLDLLYMQKILGAG